MPGFEETLRSLTGAWRIFLNRPEALRLFDFSVDGFWRSFAAIVFLLPCYALLVLAERVRILTDSIPDQGFNSGVFFLNKVVAIGLDWILLPVLLAFAVRPLGISRSYSAYIVTRNWGAVLATIPFGLIALLSLLGWINDDLATFLSLVMLAVVFRYGYLIARRVLGFDIGFAIGLVAADFCLSLILVGFIDTLFSYFSAGA